MTDPNTDNSEPESTAAEPMPAVQRPWPRARGYLSPKGPNLVGRVNLGRLHFCIPDSWS